jgi:hypothetical protein
MWATVKLEAEERKMMDQYLGTGVSWRTIQLNAQPGPDKR